MHPWDSLVTQPILICKPQVLMKDPVSKKRVDNFWRWTQPVVDLWPRHTHTQPTQTHTKIKKKYLILPIFVSTVLYFKPFLFGSIPVSNSFKYKHLKFLQCQILLFIIIYELFYFSFYFKLFFCFLRQGFSVALESSWNSLYRPVGLNSQRSACLCLLNAGIEGIHHQCLA